MTAPGGGRFLFAVPTEKRELFREPRSGPLPTDDALSAFKTDAKSKSTKAALFTNTFRTLLSSLTLSRMLSLKASEDLQ